MNVWGFVAEEEVDLSGERDRDLFAALLPMLAVLVSSGVADNCVFGDKSTENLRNRSVRDVAVSMIEEIERRGYGYARPQGGQEPS